MPRGTISEVKPDFTYSKPNQITCPLLVGGGAGRSAAREGAAPCTGEFSASKHDKCYANEDFPLALAARIIRVAGTVRQHFREARRGEHSRGEERSEERRGDERRGEERRRE